MDLVQVSFQLPTTLRDEAMKSLNAEGMTMSGFLRKAIKDYLATHAAREVILDIEGIR